MPLGIGTRLGPFEILAPLGEGGMGEVYRASDTRLNRTVALKVLPDAFSLDRDRLARFDREAQVVAALNHPNIATLYGFEDVGGRKALVLELVEGPTLADRMTQGSIPLDEAVAIAKQIAEALEAAHEQGIVHRDLKPANIKLRADGVVKVLDFGLARLTETGAADASQSPTLSPTITSPAMTGMGVILGTAAYMAPEQAAGKVADKRADIWSFGVVLWEMLAGARLFGGESTSYVLADVLRTPIDFQKVPAGPLRELLQRCLDRDVKTRLRDIGEARVALGRPLTSSVAPTVVPNSRRGAFAWTAAALLAVSTGVALWAPWRAEPEHPLVRLDVDLGSDIVLPTSMLSRLIALSPDGTMLAYEARSVGSSASGRLYVRRLNQEKAVALAGTEGASALAFSPDSKSLVFALGNQLHRISIDGGAALRLAETEVPMTQLAWVNDIIVAGAIRSGLFRIPAGGGAPVKLTELVKDEVIHAQPSVLPGGKTVLFAAGRPLTDVMTIEAVPIDGGPRKVVVPNGSAPRYLPTGHLAFQRQGTLFVVRFDPETLQTEGDAIPLLADIRTTMSGLVAVGSFSVSENGTLAYRKASGAALREGQGFRPSKVEWIDASGKRTPLVSSVGTYFDPRLSPDGTLLALTMIDSSGVDVTVFDPRRDSVPRRLSFTPFSVDPIWRTGTSVVFLIFDRGMGTQGDGELHGMAISGGQPQRFLPGVRIISTGSFSRDGSRLAYVAVDKNAPGGRPRQRRIFIVGVTEEKGILKAAEPQQFSPPQFNEYDPEFSPDGRWVAFTSDKSGQPEVYVRAAPSETTSGPSGALYEVQVSTTGGQAPKWSGANELLYQSGDQILSVKYSIKGDALVLERPVVRVEKLDGANQWDVARDGRIAVITPLASPWESGDHTVVFLQNFFDEVRRRVK